MTPLTHADREILAGRYEIEARTVVDTNRTAYVVTIASEDGTDRVLVGRLMWATEAGAARAIQRHVASLYSERPELAKGAKAT